MRIQRRPPSPDEAMAILAGRQHGVVARGQLLAEGLSRDAIGRRLRAGRLHRLHRGVYAVGHEHVSTEGRWLAAVLACGVGAMLSHRAAAALCGLPPSWRHWVEVSAARSAHPVPGVVVHRPRSLPAEDRRIVAGIPVTSVARTLVDLADVVGPRVLRQVLAQAEVLRLDATPTPIQGRRGSGRVSRALAAHTPYVPLTGSELERRMLDLCRAARFPEALVNTTIEGMEVDFAWPAQRVVVETDGWQVHGTRAAFAADRRRSAALALAGWTVIRFTWADVTSTPGYVVATLRRLLLCEAGLSWVRIAHTSEPTPAGGEDGARARLHDVRAIDVRHMGRERVICCWEVDGLLVDPGPQSCEGTLLEALGGEAPRAIVLTHIHLDHAGATGSLVRRWPDLPVHVHERGAPHLIDPAKLEASAARIYPDMKERWGALLPVPEANLHVMRDGDTVLGFRVAYTPGHASHHVSLLHEDSGTAFVGDVVGVRIAPRRYTLMPTPPPDIDVELWLESIDTVEAWRPEAFALTHFGRHEDVETVAHDAREELWACARRAREAEDADAFAAWYERHLDEHVDGDADRGVYRQANPPQLEYLGLDRYWRKHGEARHG